MNHDCTQRDAFAEWMEPFWDIGVEHDEDTPEKPKEKDTDD